MPFTLPACDRRKFARRLLSAAGAAAGFGLAGVEWSAAEEPEKPVDADRWTFLSDVHIPADPKAERHGFRPAEHLKRVLDAMLAAPTRPAHVLVNGDCALLTGEPEDYRTLVAMLGPLRAAGMPIHLSLGNHDRRDAFRAALASFRQGPSPLESHEVAVIETPRADFFLLDSLDRINELPGRLGPAQIAWLSAALGRNADKPAIVATHHPPEFVPLPERIGLLDTWPLLEVIGRRKRVKAVLFGHLHNWTRSEVGGVHYIGLPATAYPFAANRPLGWVEAALRDDGMKLEFRPLDPKQAEQGEQIDFPWRSRK
jgi:hypothetical protein